MTLTDFLNYLWRGKDTDQLALELAWVYETRQATAIRRAEHA
jgi:hypothetical protein